MKKSKNDRVLNETEETLGTITKASGIVGISDSFTAIKELIARRYDV